MGLQVSLKENIGLLEWECGAARLLEEECGAAELLKGNVGLMLSLHCSGIEVCNDQLLELLGRRLAEKYLSS